ncbi:peptidylprolyl isomerase [Blastopirellula retiformator]|uniref:peptidylprolyl isomerase n=1 Tax=Blastopirellula retiformator TaxID=2527970 RepID=A0A5C5V024_9BACT|nr:peptidylprolyl isomerase [Blastopirellula retiformator]TWT31439.1 putative bifunctional phosphatase/peptidyl-prolyl cis-trans isomerase [Blastopirellula retiformator]
MLPLEIAIFTFVGFVLCCGAILMVSRISQAKALPAKIGGNQRRKPGPHQVEALEVREVFDASGVELEGENIFIDGQFYANVDMVALAKAITATGAKFYGAVWCPHCTEQKQIFGEGGEYLPFVEVTNPDRTLNDLGSSLGITSLPTWIFADGRREEGTLTLAEVVQFSGVTVPTSTDPYIAEIDPVTLYSGEPLFLTLDGYSPTGQPLTYTVTSESGTVLSEVRQQTRSLRLTIKNFGVMEFQLLEDYASLATQQIISLVESGFYDGLVFHRIINDFMIQGGDPTGTGMGDGQTPEFNDQYDFDLRYNRAGTLGMAKSYDDTNTSQFFITENGDYRNSLDFRYTIFGYMTEGDAVREAISNIPTNASNYPSYAAVIEKAEIFYDRENALVKLDTFVSGIAGSDTLTVTATDASGNTFTRNVSVSYIPYSANKPAYLGPVPNMVVNPGNVRTFQLAGFDANGHTVRFLDKAGLDARGWAYEPHASNGLIYSVDNVSGTLTIQAPSNFRGEGQIIVAAYDGYASGSGDVDFQLITISASSAPVLVSDTFDTIAGSVNTLTPLANDTAAAPAFDLSTFELLDAPDGLQISVEGGVITYAPPLGFTGTFTLRYNVENIYGGFAADSAAITINVVANTQTVAGADAFQVDVASVAILDVLGNDRANKYWSTSAGLSIVSIGNSAAGATISIENGKLRYIPASGYTGLDTFSYSVTNGDTTAIGEVTVSVLEIEDISVTVTREKTTATSVDALPQNEAYLSEWDAFWVEIWANGDRISTQGVSAAALDLKFMPQLFSATAVEPGAGFEFNGTPAINGETGEITGLSAVATSSGLGAGNRVLLARVRFQPASGDGLAVDSDGLDFGSVFSVSNAQIQAPDTDLVNAQITSLPGVKILPVVYDLNDDGQIDLADIFTFANLYNNGAPAQSPLGDFDASGALTPYDVTLMLRELGESWVTVSSGSKLIYDFSYLEGAIAEEPLVASAFGLTSQPTTIETETVQPVMDAATAMIADAYSQLDVFNFTVATSFQIVDLPGSQLSYRHNGVIYLDIDAAGWGWFIDSTPTVNEEFTSSGDDAWAAIAAGDADGGIDLLSVILHELIGEGDEAQNPLFADTLAPSTRYLFAPEDLPVYQLLVDQAMAQA